MVSMGVYRLRGLKHHQGFIFDFLFGEGGEDCV